MCGRRNFLLQDAEKQNAHDKRGGNDTRADPLLPERARSECARSTAAVGPTRVPFQERGASELGRIILKDERRPMRAVKDSLSFLWGKK